MASPPFGNDGNGTDFSANYGGVEALGQLAGVLKVHRYRRAATDHETHSYNHYNGECCAQLVLTTSPACRSTTATTKSLLLKHRHARCSELRSIARKNVRMFKCNSRGKDVMSVGEARDRGDLRLILLLYFFQGTSLLSL